MNDHSRTSHTTTNQNDALLDKEEARKVLGNIGNTKFYQLLSSGQLSGCKIGRRTFIRRSDLNKYISGLNNYIPSNEV